MLDKSIITIRNATQLAKVPGWSTYGMDLDALYSPDSARVEVNSNMIDTSLCDEYGWQDSHHEVWAGNATYLKQLRANPNQEQESQSSKHCDAGWMNDVRFGDY